MICFKYFNDSYTQDGMHLFCTRAKENTDSKNYKEAKVISQVLPVLHALHTGIWSKGQIRLQSSQYT